MKNVFSLMSGLTLALSVPMVQASAIAGGELIWSQAPDMVNAEDNLSMHRSFGPVVADDFMSDGQEIAGFRWWGSYFENALQGADRGVSFEISFHENCPPGDTGSECVAPGTSSPYSYATPRGRTSGNHFTDIFSVAESFFGTTTNGVNIYEYATLVDPNNGPPFLGNTWETTAGETYWVDFAWAAGQFATSFSDDVWGVAKARNEGNCILGCAVQTGQGGSSNPHIGPWSSLAPEDKAFQVVGVPEPTSWLLLLAGFIGLGFARRGVFRNAE